MFTKFRSVRSLPVRGAWIEMSVWLHPQSQRSSLPVRGAWIEIASARSGEWRKSCRSPCGERGLKYLNLAPIGSGFQVAPRAGSVD